jgi:hypothetical protein
MSNDRSITVTLTFTEDNVQSFLNAANLGDDDTARKLSKLTDEEFGKLEKEVHDTAPLFIDEIVDGSYDACANNWLYGWGREEE